MFIPPSDPRFLTYGVYFNRIAHNRNNAYHAFSGQGRRVMRNLYNRDLRLVIAKIRTAHGRS